MKKSKTSRGFGIIKFKDDYGTCSLQESSSCSPPKIWLGHDEINLKVFTPGQSWVYWDDKSILRSFGGIEVNANTRMHLDRKQVKKLLPHLIKFVKTGQI